MLSRGIARLLRARVGLRLASLAALTIVCSPLMTARAQQPSAAASRRLPTSIEPTEAVGRGPLWIEGADKTEAPILVYGPSSTRRTAPLMVMLHGMCDAPQYECPSFAVPSIAGNWLVCPSANLQCGGGGAIWSGEPRIRSALIESAVERVYRRFPGRVDESAPATLIGFSLGSFVAVDVAQRSRGQWKNLLLIGAKVEPEARLLKEAGVENVLLASGDRDMMKWHMVGIASKLQRRGVRATFKSMGDVGHGFAKDMDGWLTAAMQWFEGRDEGG